MNERKKKDATSPVLMKSLAILAELGKYDAGRKAKPITTDAVEQLAKKIVDALRDQQVSWDEALAAEDAPGSSYYAQIEVVAGILEESIDIDREIREKQEYYAQIAEEGLKQ